MLMRVLLIVGLTIGANVEVGLFVGVNVDVGSGVCVGVGCNVLVHVNV